MLIDDNQTRQSLERIVCRLATGSTLRDDLRQEALVHLWLLEERRPNQTPSWYLQSCKFHLQNFLNQGRSIDSQKRKNSRVTVGLDHEEYAEFLEQFASADEFFEKLSAHDILNLLTNRLTPFERNILQLLAEGFGAREIAKKLDVTHPTVINYRRKIAVHALRLGIPPVLSYRRKLVSARATG